MVYMVKLNLTIYRKLHTMTMSKHTIILWNDSSVKITLCEPQNREGSEVGRKQNPRHQPACDGNLGHWANSSLAKRKQIWTPRNPGFTRELQKACVRGAALGWNGPHIGILATLLISPFILIGWCEGIILTGLVTYFILVGLIFHPQWSSLFVCSKMLSLTIGRTVTHKKLKQIKKERKAGNHSQHILTQRCCLSQWKRGIAANGKGVCYHHDLVNKEQAKAS